MADSVVHRGCACSLTSEVLSKTHTRPEGLLPVYLFMGPSKAHLATFFNSTIRLWIGVFPGVYDLMGDRPAIEDVACLARKRDLRVHCQCSEASH